MDVAAVPLTSLSHGAGCGCKLPAAALLPIVRDLPAATAPELLVGSATADDAAVWRISDELALVQTVDFSPRSSTTPTTSGASPLPTRCPTATPWAAGR